MPGPKATTTADALRGASTAPTPDRRALNPSRGGAGRYSGRGRLLPTGLGQAPYERRSPKAHNEAVRGRKNVSLHRVPSLEPTTATVAVPDPFGNGLAQIQATVAINVDTLEKERATGRISDAAYLTGRIIQERLERADTLGSASNWMGTSRQDPMMQHELGMLRKVILAEDVSALMERIVRAVGMIDARLLRRVLADRMSFAQCADDRGQGGARGTGYIAARFRDALEEIAAAWTAKGAIHPVPDDKHAAAAEGAVDRQRVSMAAGVTMARRAAEAREELARAAKIRAANPERRRR